MCPSLLTGPTPDRISLGQGHSPWLQYWPDLSWDTSHWQFQWEPRDALNPQASPGFQSKGSGCVNTNSWALSWESGGHIYLFITLEKISLAVFELQK